MEGGKALAQSHGDKQERGVADGARILLLALRHYGWVQQGLGYWYTVSHAVSLPLLPQPTYTNATNK